MSFSPYHLCMSPYCHSLWNQIPITSKRSCFSFSWFSFVSSGKHTKLRPVLTAQCNWDRVSCHYDIWLALDWMTHAIVLFKHICTKMKNYGTRGLDHDDAESLVGKGHVQKVQELKKAGKKFGERLGRVWWKFNVSLVMSLKNGQSPPLHCNFCGDLGHGFRADGAAGFNNRITCDGKNGKWVNRSRAACGSWQMMHTMRQSSHRTWLKRTLLSWCLGALTVVSADGLMQKILAHRNHRMMKWNPLAH